jgi:hypothetical protein
MLIIETKLHPNKIKELKAKLKLLLMLWIDRYKQKKTVLSLLQIQFIRCCAIIVKRRSYSNHQEWPHRFNRWEIKTQLVVLHQNYSQFHIWLVRYLVWHKFKEVVEQENFSNQVMGLNQIQKMLIWEVTYHQLEVHFLKENLGSNHIWTKSFKI